MFSYGLQHMDTPVLANQQKLTFISSVQTLISLFNDISTFMGYLMPKSSLYKNSSGTI